MTDLLERERKATSAGGNSSRLEVQPATSRTVSRLLRALSVCSYLAGYTIITLVVLAALIELACWAFWSVHPLTRQAELENQIGSPVYLGAEWAPQFWQEETLRRNQRKPYVPFRLWGVTEWHSQYINNDRGLNGVWRRTNNPANCTQSTSLIIWTFGGSTMYGTAVPDWATIPAYLSQKLNVQGHGCVEVSNFGVEGYVTDQELILLAELLKAGGHPDVVIYYDGVNDSSLAWPPSASPKAHFELSTIKNRVEGSISGRIDFLQKSYAMRVAGEVLARSKSDKVLASLIAKAQPNVLKTVDKYEANMRLVRALGEAYKFKVYCFWQPILIYGHKPLVPFEQEMAVRDAGGDSPESAWFLVMAAVYREAERRAAATGNFVFLGGLFDSTREPLYVDEAHLGPRGNEIVAEAIARYIQDHRAE